MRAADELRLLRGEASPTSPAAGLSVRVLEVACPTDAAGVLARGREVMEAVLARSGGEWASLDEWKLLLPAWFVERCVDDREIQSCVVDRWSLRAWLHWLRPENRQWWWWRAETVTPALVRVELVSDRDSFLLGALEWLFKAAGGGEARLLPRA